MRTGTPVTNVGEGSVTIGTERIVAETVLWAAGVAASPLGRSARRARRSRRARARRAGPDGSGAADVFVIGDLASLSGRGGRPLPGVAQVAMQMGQHAVKNILRAMEGQPLRAFSYRDLGNMATIGRASAMADFGMFSSTGDRAWLAWLFVHLMNLIGFRNRIVVLVQWAWAYFSYQRAIRLITGYDPSDARERRPGREGMRGRGVVVLILRRGRSRDRPVPAAAVERYSRWGSTRRSSGC